MANLQETFLFQPTSVPGCQLWLDAADSSTVTLSGLNVTQWNDKSGNARNATAGTATYPVYQRQALNSNSIITMRGANDYFTVATNFDSATFPSLCYLMVVRPATTQPNTANAGLLSTDTPGLYGRTLALGAGFWQEEYYSGFNNITAYTAEQWANVSLQFVTTTSVTLAVNGITYTGTASGAGNNTDGLKIGSYNNTGAYATYNADFDVAEILIYGVALTVIQRQQIEGYLAWKWGLQGNLPSTHPYKTYRPLAQTPFPTSIPPMPIAIQNAPFFLPTLIPGCQVWLDAADPNGNGSIPANATSISTWTDKSGNGRNAVNQTTSAILYTNVQNGLSILRFDGTNNYLITYASFPNTAYTIFTVQYLSNNNGSFRRVIHAPTAADAAVFVGVYGSSVATFTGNGNGSWNDTNANSPAVSNLNAWRLVDTWVSSSTLTPYVDGTAQTNKVGTTGTFSNLTLGMKPGTVQPWVGDVAEILIYNSALTTLQRQQVEGYLAWKWGLNSSLPNDHPYKTQPISPFPPRITPFQGSLNQWIPTQLSGCRLWLNAADRSGVSLSGSTILNVIDKSGQGVAFTTAAGFTYTPNGLNGLPVFSGSAAATCTLGSNTSFTLAQPFSVFYVGNYNTAVGTAFLFDDPTNRVSISMQLGGAYQFGQTGTFLTGSSTPFSGNHFSSAVFNSTNSSIRLNGAAFQSGSMGSSGFTGTIVLASRFTAVSPWRSFLGELLVYSGALTLFQIQQVEGYLAWKWGLVGNLPATHPYKKWPPSP